MSYQIVYGPRKQAKKVTAKKQVRIYMMIVILLVIALAAVRFTGYNSLLWETLIPGDPDVTMAAFQNMTLQIQNGNGLTNAVSTFCETVIEGAKLGS